MCRNATILCTLVLQTLQVLTASQIKDSNNDLWECLLVGVVNECVDTKPMSTILNKGEVAENIPYSFRSSFFKMEYSPVFHPEYMIFQPQRYCNQSDGNLRSKQEHEPCVGEAGQPTEGQEIQVASVPTLRISIDRL